MEAKRPKQDALTKEQQDRIIKNREAAERLRSSKLKVLARTPKAKCDLISSEPQTDESQSLVKVNGVSFIDGGGGFLITKPQCPTGTVDKNIPVDDVLVLPIVHMKCLECEEKFQESYLWTNFDYSVCNKCQDMEEKHSLITKSEAKSEYLLSDVDIEKRPPPLKFIKKKNPHNERWGDMKLFLHIQVEKRAMEVWKSEDAIIKEKQAREDKRQLGKIKKHNKQMKDLRMNVRSSVYDRTTAYFHQHVYGEESYNEEDDTYSHTCTECNFEEIFEKM